MKIHQLFICSSLCLQGLLGLTLCASPVAAQVFELGPSPASRFQVVLNLPGDEAIITGGDSEHLGSALTTQVNVNDGGTVGMFALTFADTEVNIRGGTVGSFFNAFFFSEVNISGGTVGDYFRAFTDSVVNISGGTVGDEFDARQGSLINISGGTVGDNFQASRDSVVNISGGAIGDHFSSTGRAVNISGGTVGELFNAFSDEVNISGGTVGFRFSASSSTEVNITGGVIGGGFLALIDSTVNIVGSEFFIDGVELDTLQVGQVMTIFDRDVTLSGLLADGEPFSFDLNSGNSFPDDHFSPNATLTVRLVSPSLLGDCNQDGVVDFLDISPFIAVLASSSFLEQADCNQDGVVSFLDIGPLIAILAAQ